jgi:hypothetical protein
MSIITPVAGGLAGHSETATGKAGKPSGRRPALPTSHLLHSANLPPGNRLPSVSCRCYIISSPEAFPGQRGPLTLTYFILFLLFGVTNFAFTLMILRELTTEKKGLSFFDLRWYVLRNLNHYKALTRSRYGKVGFPFYGYLATLGGLILSAILCLDSLSR